MYPPLHDACRKNDITYVKNNVTKENVNEKHIYGGTPFSLACRHGYKQIVEILLKTDGFNSLNEKNSNGNTPFVVACWYGCKEIVEMLLKTDGFNSLNKKNNSGNTPFSVACLRGHKEIVKMLLKTDGFNGNSIASSNPPSSGLNEKDNHDNTPFLLACWNGHKEIVEMLLKADGFNSLNEKDNDGNTPFLLACRCGRKEIVKILLKQPKIIIAENIKYNYMNVDTSEIQSLIELYKKDPPMLRTKLILGNNLDIYRHIVFTSDGYFTIKKIESSNTRFMKIVTRLPLDLQMVLIYRLSSSTKQNITGKMFDDNIEDYINKYIKNNDNIKGIIPVW